MYFVPQPHECPKCNHKQGFSIDALTVNFSNLPFCPKCFENWIKEHVPLMVKKEQPPIKFDGIIVDGNQGVGDIPGRIIFQNTTDNE